MCECSRTYAGTDLGLDSVLARHGGIGAAEAADVIRGEQPTPSQLGRFDDISRRIERLIGARIPGFTAAATTSSRMGCSGRKCIRACGELGICAAIRRHGTRQYDEQRPHEYCDECFRDERRSNLLGTGG